ncbi:tyrosine-type recombinase/integrase [Lysobacter changpingensis]|uniref:tyrosine-type recombinase/integrase n=1 Tax=Lysobacter changpingensis TaxID=2792784 RepID=UPI001A8F6905|nr:site-specific integrase [Lysobacter changpingensis]
MKVAILSAALAVSWSAQAADVASCSDPVGQGYFPEIGLIGKKDAGWSEERITGGITKLVKTGESDLDILFVDARKDIVSARDDGGRVSLLTKGENAFSVIVVYPGTTAEVYTFLKNSSGHLEYLHTLSRSGDGVLITKASVMRGDCSYIRDRHRDRKTRDIRAQAKVETALSRKRIKASPARADGAVRALRAVVNYLRAERGLDLPDVAKRITATKGWGNVARRKRALIGDTLPEFVAAVRSLPEDLPPDLSGTQRDLTLFLLCTALRWTAGAGLEWSEIDFKAKTITIPKERMKGKVAHSLPLGPQMLAMLKQRQKDGRSDRYVFPGLGRDEKGRINFDAL